MEDQYYNKDVFLSYSRTDFEIAQKISIDLSEVGISCWIDTEDIYAGENWRIKIKKAINNCPFFLCLLSNKAQKTRGFRHNEIKQAIEIVKILPPDQVYIIPARIEECVVLYEEFENLNWVDLFPDWNKGVGRIAGTIFKYLDKKITNTDFNFFIKEIYVNFFGDIKVYSPLSYVYHRTGRVYEIIFNENIRRGNWIKPGEFDHTIVYYMAEWIVANVKNYKIIELGKGKLAEEITNSILNYFKSDYHMKRERIYHKHLDFIRRDSSKKYIFQQAEKVYDDMIIENVNNGLWEESNGFDHEMVYYLSEWIKDKVENTIVESMTILDLAKGITDYKIGIENDDAKTHDTDSGNELDMDTKK